MPRSATARAFLKLNSQFSALNGILLLIMAEVLASTLLADPADWAAIALRGLGIGLVGFAVLLYMLSRNKYVSRAAVKEIVLLDALWVAGSIVLIAFFGDLFTTIGIIIITAVAMVVAFFAIAQFAAAANIQQPVAVADVVMRDGSLMATVKRTVNAPAEVVWEVMTDHPAYSDVASNIAKVEVLSGDELGMQRRCYGPKGENWLETCNLFESGKSYGFRIHTDAEDYPYLIATLSGRWSVERRAIGSAFDIEIVAKPKGSVLSQWLFVTMAKLQYKTVLVDLADGWAKRMEKEANR